MPLDYSKWDNLEDSDDEEPAPKPAAKAPAAPAAPPPAKPSEALERPKEAQGSAWNLNSWHFEEQKHDAWGKDRLKALLNGTRGDAAIEFEGLELEFEWRVSVRKVDGEAWTHVRKGKKVTGYNYELDLSWSGRVQGRGGGQSSDCSGGMEYELTVDDDEPDVTCSCAQSYPFWAKMKVLLVGFVEKKCATFVKELSQRGESGPGWKASPTQDTVQVGQYQKYEGADGVAALQETARKYSQQKEQEGGKVGKAHNGKELHCAVPTL